MTVTNVANVKPFLKIRTLSLGLLQMFFLVSGFIKTKVKELAFFLKIWPLGKKTRSFSTFSNMYKINLSVDGAKIR